MFLMCNIFKGKKSENKNDECLESPIQPKGIRFDPFLKFLFFVTDKANAGKNVAPWLGLRGNLVVA